MRRSEKKKLCILFAATIIVVAAAWMIFVHAQEDVPAGRVEKENRQFLSDSSSPVEDTAQVMGTLKLAGKKYEYYNEMETYLFIGMDASGEDSAGGEYQGNMADFLLLAVLDKTEKKYCFIQLDRDTMAEVRLLARDNTGVATAKLQLCAASWYGGDGEAGCRNVAEAVSNLFGGLVIDGYYSLNMKSIADINHMVGGVEVTLEEDIPEGGEEMKKGVTVTLTDEQAYHYLHDRYGVGDETNVSRMKRHRQYMKAFLEKAGQLQREDKAFVLRLYQKMENDAISSISGKDISRIAKLMQDGQDMGIREFSGTSGTGQALGDGIDHREFYLDKKSVVKVLTEVYGLVRQSD